MRPACPSAWDTLRERRRLTSRSSIPTAPRHPVRRTRSGSSSRVPRTPGSASCCRKTARARQPPAARSSWTSCPLPRGSASPMDGCRCGTARRSWRHTTIRKTISGMPETWWPRLSKTRSPTLSPACSRRRADLTWSSGPCRSRRGLPSGSIAPKFASRPRLPSSLRGSCRRLARRTTPCASRPAALTPRPETGTTSRSSSRPGRQARTWQTPCLHHPQ